MFVKETAVALKVNKIRKKKKINKEK